ncbi:C40 family peptidase [Streptomyces sp. A1-5]|nr:C40 family peptidase [Streptomyces noursei]UJB43531.1 C40 family peptidase [Streptomyces sp. A1-5]
MPGKGVPDGDTGPSFLLQATGPVPRRSYPPAGKEVTAAMASHHTAGERPPLAPPPAGPRTARTARTGLLLAADPQRYLDGATVLERTGSHQATAVSGWARRLGSVRRLGGHPLATAERSPEAAAPRLPAYALPRALEPAVAAPAPPDPAPGNRAARAVAFAHGALGKPYAWGATGPAAYDCSGLTLAAWRAGGVALPRTTYTQITSGTRVDWPQLAPGDLVFFYSGISHVGLYIGGGEMIHAPHPGTPVEIAPLDRLPFAGATRPA